LDYSFAWTALINGIGAVTNASTAFAALDGERPLAKLRLPSADLVDDEPSALGDDGIWRELDEPRLLELLDVASEWEPGLLANKSTLDRSEHLPMLRTEVFDVFVAHGDFSWSGHLIPT
jgi:hypothetical protein